jgi:hypothetical protein
MNEWGRGACLIVFLLLIASGCAQESSAPPLDKEAKIKASLDELDPADRELAEDQKYCAVETEKRLGSMNKPIKIMVKDQPVFLCCAGCEKRALKDPDKTLETVKRLRSHQESHE